MDKLMGGRNWRWQGRQAFGIITVLIFGCGILFGVLACHILDTDRLRPLTEYYAAYFQSTLPQSSAVAIYRSIIQTNLLDLLKLIFFGLCLIGAPFILILLFTKGFAIGFVAAVLLLNTGLKGAAAVLCGVVLPKLIYIPLILSAGAFFLQCSWELLSRQMSAYWLQFIVRCLLLALGLIAAGCLEGFLLQNVFGEFLGSIFSAG